MRTIWTIAKNTFREAIRDRILYGIVAFAFIFIAFTIFLGSISLGEDVLIIKSLGLAGIYLFGLIITVFLSTSLLSKEIEKRTLYFVITRPVSHQDIVVGKYIGLLLSVLVTLAAMAVVYVAVVFTKSGAFDGPALVAIFLELCELSVFISLSILFSSFAAPLSSIIYSVLVLYIGHSLTFLLEAAARSGGVMYYASLGIYYVLPNLEKFNARNYVIYGHTIGVASIALTAIYAVAWSSLALYLAVIALKKREL